MRGAASAATARKRPPCVTCALAKLQQRFEISWGLNSARRPSEAAATASNASPTSATPAVARAQATLLRAWASKVAASATTCPLIASKSAGAATPAVAKPQAVFACVHVNR